MVTARGTGLPSGLPRDTVANNSAIVASDSCILSISLRYMVDGIQEGKSGIRDGMAHRVRPAGPGRRENLEFVPAFYVRLNSAIASSKWRSCRMCSARLRAGSRHVTSRHKKEKEKRRLVCYIRPVGRCRTESIPCCRVKSSFLNRQHGGDYCSFCTE